MVVGLSLWDCLGPWHGPLSMVVGLPRIVLSMVMRYMGLWDEAHHSHGATMDRGIVLSAWSWGSPGPWDGHQHGPHHVRGPTEGHGTDHGARLSVVVVFRGAIVEPLHGRGAILGHPMSHRLSLACRRAILGHAMRLSIVAGLRGCMMCSSTGSGGRKGHAMRLSVAAG